MTKCFDKTTLPSIWMFWPQASAIRWDVERILKSSMWIIFLILFLFSEFTTKTNRRLIWLSKQRKLLFNMFRLSQHYLKGSRHSNMLIREGEWYFNSIHRREADFFFFEKFFSSFTNWRNIHNECWWSKEIPGAEFQQTRNCSQSEGIYSKPQWAT